ncbi:MAG TPA: hypothetical protein VGV38_00900, partial [Pyrinomonadaceae bacterium]|nr:hypothetical protein [Pyrinomonadaceae bacterium]
RRTTAVAVVSTLADEARDFRDVALRARVQARAADVLWETEREKARALFRRAFEAADAADRESQRKFEEELQRGRAGGGPFVTTTRTLNLRGEVLRLAARRDRALGEEFLNRVDEARRQELEDVKRQDAAAQTSSAAPTPTPAQPRSQSDNNPSQAQRLGLAEQLVRDGEVEAGVQFGGPALAGKVTQQAVSFLTYLREKDPAAADKLYASVLARAAADPESDANTVSLLASYVFSPHTYVTFTPTGGASTSRMGEGLPRPAEVSPQLRAAYLNAAASILLRPLSPAEQDATSTARVGTYLVVARLLPIFEQHAPDKVAALNTKLAALAPDTPERLRQRNNRALTEGLVPDDPTRDRVQEHLNRLNSAKDASDRDEIYLNAAMAAADRDDPRAAEFADKIENLDLRRQLRAVLAFEALREALSDWRDKKQERDPADMLRLARSDALTPIQRAWGLTELARLLSKPDAPRAVEILEEAFAEARRIDLGSPDRARALVAIATQFVALDRGRAWEVMSEVVKASNSAAEFTGEDGQVSVTLRSKNSGIVNSSSADSFDLAGVFAALAKEDLDRALQLARAFTGEAPRAAATLAVARAVLEKK